MADIIYMVMCECYINKHSNYTKVIPVSNKRWSTYEAAYDEAVKYLDKEDILEIWIETKCISKIVGL